MQAAVIKQIQGEKSQDNNCTPISLCQERKQAIGWGTLPGSIQLRSSAGSLEKPSRTATRRVGGGVRRALWGLEDLAK